MALNIVDELVHFASDQLRVISGWQGVEYVKRCLALWEREYGRAIVADVRSQLRTKYKELKR